MKYTILSINLRLVEMKIETYLTLWILWKRRVPGSVTRFAMETSWDRINLDNIEIGLYSNLEVVTTYFDIQIKANPK